MEQLKTLFDEVIAYCVGVPFHAVTLLAAVTLTLAAAIALVCVYTRSERKQPTPEVLPEEAPVEEVLVEEEVVEEVVEDQGDEALPEITVTVKPITAQNKKKPVAEKPRGANIEKNKRIAYKEGTMLLDELKDIDTQMDFYEEDEADRMARYSGKWTICRVVTNDSENSDMYFFELHASNGEKLLTSEEYTNYNAAVRGIETHKTNLLRGNYRLTTTKNGEYTYKLLTGKGLLLCMGEAYASKDARDHGIELTKRFARTAFIDENILDVVVKVPEEAKLPLPVLPDGFDGKWVIDCRNNEQGERVFYFELLNDEDEALLTSEEYSSYVGTINSIQTHKTNIKNGNFRILLTKQGDYVYKLLNGNKQLLYLGEHYKTRRLCEYAVEVIKKYAAHSPVLTDPELMKEEE